MRHLPDLGVGVVYSPGLEPWLEAGNDLIDVIELEPQSFWLRRADGSFRVHREAYERFREFPQPKIIHGVGFPVAGSLPPDPGHSKVLLETIEATASPWVSEHLSFNRYKDLNGAIFNAGFLLPPLQTEEAVSLAARHIRDLKSTFPVPFAFETGVNYLAPLPGEISEGAFFRAVAERADCGILLDLHNLWCNERNGRQPLVEAVEEMPRERVWEVHLAGGQERDGYWLDAHSDLVPEPLMELAERVIARLPNVKAVVFELMADYAKVQGLDPKRFRDQLQRMRALFEARGRDSHRTAPIPPRAPASEAALPKIRDWERALGSLTIGRAPTDELSRRLAADPGVSVLRRLVAAVRAGMTADTLKLTYRLISLSLGEERFLQLLRSFWEKTPPEPFPSDEAENFARFLESQRLELPHLREVLSFELTTQRVLVEGRAQVVRFDVSPLPIVAALSRGELPARRARAEDEPRYELTITP